MRIRPLQQLLTVSLMATSLVATASEFDIGTKEWRMPIDNYQGSISEIVDSDPSSRDASLSVLRDRTHINNARLTAASRFSLVFELGRTTLSSTDIEQLNEFMGMHAEGADVIVVGYSDYVGSESSNILAAVERARNAADVVKETRPESDIAELSSTHWAGDSKNARRVDVFLVPQLMAN